MFCAVGKSYGTPLLNGVRFQDRLFSLPLFQAIEMVYLVLVCASFPDLTEHFFRVKACDKVMLCEQ